MTSIIYSGTENSYFFRIYTEKGSSAIALDVFNQYGVRVKHGLYTTTKQAKNAALRFMKNK